MTTIDIYERIISDFVKTGSMREAYDAVMGDGAYKRLADDVYDGINARAEVKSDAKQLFE